MNCVWCGTHNFGGAITCAGCGREIGAAAREVPTEPVAPAPDVWSAYSAPGAVRPPEKGPEAVTPPSQPATVVPRAEPTLPPPAGTPADPQTPPTVSAGLIAPPDDDGAVPGEEPDRRSRTPRLVGLVAAAAVLLLVLALVVARWRSGGDSDATSGTSVPADSTVAVSAPPTTATAVSTTVDAEPAPTTAPAPAPASTSAPETTPAPDPTPAPAPDPTPAAEPDPAPPPAPDATPAPSAPPAVEPDPTPPATEATNPPTTTPVTTTPPAAPGANVLADPLPSGLASADVAASLGLAQDLASALAAGDWDAARRLSPGLASSSDAEFEDGYEGLDRASLLLVDARRTGGIDELLVALIANERAGAQTTIYCVESTVSPTGFVTQRAAFVLDRTSTSIGVDDARRDVALADLIRGQCVWN
ncbi:MAG: hypothetical protein ACR2HP_00500 [Ilumatobacteraceae bacterium]